jgi:hypothetical protein
LLMCCPENLINFAFIIPNCNWANKPIPNFFKSFWCYLEFVRSKYCVLVKLSIQKSYFNSEAHQI